MAEPIGTNIGGDTADQLRGYVAAIEALEAEAKDVASRKAEVYKELKSTGFDKATVRKLIARRRKDRDEVDEEDALLDMYEQALLTNPTPAQKRAAAVDPGF